MTDPLFLLQSDIWTRERFDSVMDAVSSGLGPVTCIGICTLDPVLLNACLILGATRNYCVQVFHAPNESGHVRSLAQFNGAQCLVTGNSETPVFTPVDSAVASSPSQAPWVGIYTSGTSGTPKLSLHSWSTVQKPARFAEQGLHGARWLMCYAPTTYAGLQVFFTCYGSGGLLVYPVGTMGEIWQSILQMKVDVISATPTFWRMLASTWQPGNNLRLRQATLGGEIVRQDLLDLVASRFHPMKLTHIYASTETGPALVVSDGQEGFPSAWLERTQGPVQVRIGSEGLLELRSAYRMMAYADGRPTFDDGWFRTPDLVERRGDRVHFLGRKDSIINMGGLKVPIDSVESAILGIPDILDCRVYQRASPIIGSLLCADLLLRSSDAPPGVPELKRIMRETLGHLPIPQFVQIVDSIRMAQSGKKAR